MPKEGYGTRGDKHIVERAHREARAADERWYVLYKMLLQDGHHQATAAIAATAAVFGTKGLKQREDGSFDIR